MADATTAARARIDRALADLERHVVLLVVMATASFGLRFTYRYLLFGTACRIETDLRAAIYQHLTFDGLEQARD